MRKSNMGRKGTFSGNFLVVVASVFSILIIAASRLSIVFLISIILVSSSLYLLPLAYSQQLSFFPIFKEERYELLQPEGIAVDSFSGNVYVADTANNRIQVFSSNGTFISEWGGDYGSGEGEMRSPAGIALDQEGNVYVADTANNRIQVFSSNGTFISEWGEAYSFNLPTGVAVDSFGNVYVADTANNRIQVFSSNNGTLLTEWGEYGTDSGSFNLPTGVAVDSFGNVYVADTANNRIQVFSSNGTFISTVEGYGMELKIRYPKGVAVDQEGNVYVADTGNHQFIAFSPHSPISDVAFSSEEGFVYGNDTRLKIEPVYDGLALPLAIAFLGPNDMLVAQNNNNNTIVRIVNGQMLDEPVLDLEDNLNVIGCVCDIAVLQNDNGTLYGFVYYAALEVTEDDESKKIVNSLYRYDLTNGKFTNPKSIFEIPSNPAALHQGGKVMIGPDNNIYVTVGEIDHYFTKAINVKNGSMPDGSGGILRFTPDGSPVDGGLIGGSHPVDKYYAYGIRNSFGLDYDPLTGNIWMTDNGPTTDDELNLVRPGFNGGWNKIMGMHNFTYNRAFNLTDLEFFNGTGQYYDPIFDWFESLGITDLVFVPSDKLGKEYEGNLFVTDNNYGFLYRFILNQTRTGLLLNGSLSDGVADNNLEMLEAVIADIEGGVITDLEIGPDGLLYIVSNLNGKILRLEPMDANATLPVIETNPTDTDDALRNDLSSGNTTNSVSIVPGSSSLTTDAYQPNPIQVSVGTTVTWTNDDSQPHTATSGENATPDGRFDSGIMAPSGTFEHTFTEAGEYPYFCLLHPNMVGTVSVS
jgi:glucose/arabinose dehydrogenase/plastocyanin/sugar lactone lactonase YvrE